MNKITQLIFLFFLIPINLSTHLDESIHKSYTYFNDITISEFNAVAIIADSTACVPYIGFIDQGDYQQFNCTFQNATQEANNLILFEFTIREFPHIMFAPCFSANYSNEVKYQNISTC